MKILTVDASAAAAWLIPSQSTQASSALELAIEDYALTAPEIFAWEMRNVLIRQRRRTPAYDLYGALIKLAAYEIQVSDVDLSEHLDELTDIAHTAGVSLFDAAYFWAVSTDGSTLVSRDSGLLALCQKHGLDHIDLR